MRSQADRCVSSSCSIAFQVFHGCPLDVLTSEGASQQTICEKYIRREFVEGIRSHRFGSEAALVEHFHIATQVANNVAYIAHFLGIATSMSQGYCVMPGIVRSLNGAFCA